MDVNGTRFRLLLGERDWAPGDAPGGTAGTGVEWDQERGDLTLARSPFVFPAHPGDRPPAIEDRRDAACDRFGSRYWIDDDAAAVLVEPAAAGRPSVFWRPGPGEGCAARRGGAFGPLPGAPPADPEPLALAGLAVTADHLLVVGVTRPSGLLVFDLAGGGPPTRTHWPASAGFRPFDMAASPHGGVVVLDRDGRCLWELDRRLGVVRRTPRPAAPGPAPGRFAPAAGAPCVAWRDPRPEPAADDAAGGAGLDPVAVAVAPDGTVLVLDRGGGGPSVVRAFRDGAALSGAAVLGDGAGLAVTGHDMALVPGPGPADATLYVASATGDQAFAFRLMAGADGITLSLLPAYHPMRRFGGRALIAEPGRAVYDAGGRWRPLVAHPQASFARSGTVVTRTLDGEAPGCTWHRVVLDACIPPGTGVRVRSRAADDRAELDDGDWYDEPPLVARPESEQPFPPAGPEGVGSFELLLQRARGRHLRLRLDLEGDGARSPRLHALRVHFPRFSYLERYLPRAYRQDAASADFLERFLANPEGLLTALEDRVVAVRALFDALAAPADALPWLASWLAVGLDPRWGEARRRAFLRHAVEAFRWRGTERGLQIALRLALDPPGCADEGVFSDPSPGTAHGARIVERFATRPRPGAGAWRPADGADALLGRWRTAAAGLAGAGPRLPLARPGDPALAAAWDAVTLAALGMTPAWPPEPARWRAFLERRHARIGVLNDAYGLTGSARHAGFDDVPVPAELPDAPAALADWHDVATVVEPMRRAASRFTVLLPVPLGDSAGPEDLGAEERRELVRRVVEAQKPAHTAFDVRFFWAAFRVGEARLGLDTVVDLGSRSPRLLEAAVLGREHAGEAVLGGEEPPVITAQPAFGRERLTTR